MPTLEEKILVVEDYGPLRDVIVDTLTRSGYTEITAVEGEEGIGALVDANGDFALVITGRLDVLEFTAREYLQVKKLLLVGIEEEGEEVIGEGTANAYLLKPFDIDDLAGMVADLLNDI